MKHFLSIIPVLCFSFTSLANCTCERVSLSLGLAHSSHIFEAQVLSFSSSVVNLKEIKRYKGHFFPEVQRGLGSCPPQFQVGESYVFYLKEGRVESECDQFFLVKNKGLYQQFLKLTPAPVPAKK